MRFSRQAAIERSHRAKMYGFNRRYNQLLGKPDTYNLTDEEIEKLKHQALVREHKKKILAQIQAQREAMQEAPPAREHILQTRPRSTEKLVTLLEPKRYLNDQEVPRHSVPDYYHRDVRVAMTEQQIQEALFGKRRKR